ncbi:ParB/RepB/Spo0J family partition domain protein [Paraburkholderia fungorum]|jgi:ParB family transcriptional regulator, chromosome partitioning protein|uniref:ParB family chromosome partitioning protein n=1 Tax=Paraburkholderia fungorum TaxID=134537 RepID=A0AAJ3SGD6_9BURK|nr:ParB/RepB/Spo0J family partition protein [Paraburkholderia fungorum]KFX62792.1 chromosome partitioning protein ParB [Burkholderia sp. K24]AJZ64142.1 ParB/RepB/Spo0J family partition domain protein [Paraburkholderia fungorum]MBB4512990.1 ParB family chromosome partitioning protein [Paraburkholderia fungorum]MBB5540728.1 ParB family chromosome partitioning protein [Paraburkholderia fungorum]MBB6201581.1 ParB family chromosome partitioning protein [Paraburkholderia fungorum]
MKPSQFAKGFQARPDTTSSEKRTALDRLNAIDDMVKTGDVPSRTIQPMTPQDVAEVDAADTANESAAYRAWRIEHAYRPGQVIELALKTIKPSPFNPRHFYLKSSIAELAVNLAKQGQQQAIHVIPDYDNPGTYFVSDGGRRVRALKEANKESVKAIVIDLPIGLESYKLGYDLNVQRDSQTVFDNAVVWKRFLDDRHFQSQKELAEHLGLDESTVAVALSIAKLPEAVMHEMVARPDRFGSNMAYQVGRYHTARGADATLRLINKILSDDLSTRQVADIVKGRASAQESTKPAGRQRYAQRLEIKLGGVAVGDLKSYGDDRIELRLKGLTREKRDDILRQIEKMLK